MTNDNENFIDKLASEYNIHSDTILYKYLLRKTKAFDRGSKARRSLGNLYALYVLCEDYANGKSNGSRFTELLQRMKDLPFGTKLQNHPLDNRLNDEVRRQYSASDDQLPVQPSDSGDGKKARKISTTLLTQNGSDPISMANFVVAAIVKYVSIIDDNQLSYLRELENATTPADKIAVISSALEANSDARLFEIVSFALLHLRYAQSSITFKSDGKTITENLTLYKTGRTNANDGGIDFVLRPLGRFFQVSETLDFKKYFLDFEKINKFPMTFVIKTESDKKDVYSTIRHAAETEYSNDTVDKYMELIEDIITNVDLRELIDEVANDAKKTEICKSLIIENFQLEFGLLD